MSILIGALCGIDDQRYQVIQLVVKVLDVSIGYAEDETAFPGFDQLRALGVCELVGLEGCQGGRTGLRPGAVIGYARTGQRPGS